MLAESASPSGYRKEMTGWSLGAVLTVGICAVAGGMDSFDTQMIGFTGRQIANDLKFPVSELGWLFSAGQLGGVLGAVIFGLLADRFGRARILVVTCLLAAAFTAATLVVPSFKMLLLYRVVTGLGLGGIMPCFLGLGVEAMPPKARVAVTTVLYSCFPLGGVVGAWISTPLMVAFGWRGVFAFGAGALLIIGVVVALLPLVENAPVQRQQRVRISALLAGNRSRISLPLWALFLLAPPGIYLLALWMPSLLQLLGVTAAKTTALVGFLNLGSLAIGICGGWIMIYLGRMRTVAPALLLGALSFTAIALCHRNYALLLAVVTLAGAALGGAMSLLVTMAANAYPAELRATGIGSAMGFSKLGQMLAPVPIGLLLGAGVSPSMTLAACGLPPLLSLIPLVIFDRASKRRDKPPATEMAGQLLH